MAEDINAIEMSDEAFLAENEGAVAGEFDDTDHISDSEFEDDNSNDDVSDTSNSVVDNTDDNSEEVEIEETHDDNQENEDETDELETDEDTQENNDSEDSENQDDSKDSEGDEPDTEEDTQETGDTDFKGEYEKLLKPFKANGKNIKIDSVDDAITLMQMGANYNSKMLAIKGNLKIVKMLETNGLLDQDKLNNLIDLHNKDKGAITKLVKDSGIDPLDIDTKSEHDYKAKDYSIDDITFDLTTAIDDIRGNDSFEKSMDVMGNKWDTKSQNIIKENPEIVSVVDKHIQEGIFDTVQDAVATERALGRMKGLSDVEAYRDMAHTLEKKGVLTLEAENSVQTDTQDADDNALKVEAGKKKKQADALTRNNKRKAAAPTKKTGGNAKTNTNYLEMSDEDFMKKYS